MSFLVFSIKNIFRNKLLFIVAIILLIIGIFVLIFSMGVGYFADDLLQTSNLNDNGGADFTIYSNNIFSNNTLSLGELNKIQSTKGVKEAVGMSFFHSLVHYSDNNTDIVFHPNWIGFTGKDLSNDCRVPGIGHIKLIKGRLPTPGTHEILITNDIAKDMNIIVGKNLTLMNLENLGWIVENNNTKQLNFRNNKDRNSKFVQLNFIVVGTTAGLYNGKISAEKFYTTNPDIIVDLGVFNQILYGSNTIKFDFIHVKADANHIDQTKNGILEFNPHYIIWNEEETNSKSNILIMYLIMFSLIIGVDFVGFYVEEYK